MHSAGTLVGYRKKTRSTNPQRDSNSYTRGRVPKASVSLGDPGGREREFRNSHVVGPGVASSPHSRLIVSRRRKAARQRIILVALSVVAVMFDRDCIDVRLRGSSSLKVLTLWHLSTEGIPSSTPRHKIDRTVDWE